MLQSEWNKVVKFSNVGGGSSSNDDNEDDDDNNADDNGEKELNIK